MPGGGHSAHVGRGFARRACTLSRVLTALAGCPGPECPAGGGEERGVIVVDDKLWPLLTVELSGGYVPWELERYLEAVMERLHRREPYVCLLDASRSQALSPEQRHRQALWLKQHEALLRQYCMGSAFVVSSAAVRLSLNVIFALRPLVMPHVVVASREAAAAWAADRLEATGQPLHAFRVRGAYGLLRGQRIG